MRHQKGGRKLNRTPSHRQAMLRTMVTSLFEHERIATTLPKAKELRPVAERLITLAKRGTLHARRLAAQVIRDKNVLKKLFDTIGPRFNERPGGYTRVVKLGRRSGDAAPRAFIELIKELASAEGEARQKRPTAEATKPSKEAKKPRKLKKAKGGEGSR